MQFAQPLWLFAGFVTCAFLFWRYQKFQSQQRGMLARFAAVRLLDKLTASVSPGRRKAKQAFFVLGVFCLFVALARPQAGYEWQETRRKGLELLFAVDTSKSMLAQDVKPDRLSRAKLAVHDLVDKLNGDGVGLVAFAGNAFLQCPVTLDYDAFRESLDALDTKVIPRGGTDIAAAIGESVAVFKTRSAPEKVLILITDGEDLGGEGIAAAKEAAKNGVKIFAVGVGSTTGELVPVPSENGGTDFAKDASGQLVKSHLDEATLKQIAEATGGMYQPLGQQGEGLSTIYEQGLASFARHDLSSRQAKVFLEQFHWALFAALACFVGEMMIGTRRKVRTSARTPAPLRTKTTWARRPAITAIALLALVLLGTTSATHAALPQSAEQAYQKGDFQKSQQEYATAAAKEPTKTELQFNAGSAAYKAGDLAKATTAFQNSLHTEEVPLQQGAYYNLGNTQFRLGQKTEKSNPKETIETWGQAVRSYDAALQIEPGDDQAKHNRDLVQHKIDQLKKQEEEKKQQQQQDKKDQQQQDQKSDPKDQKNDPKNQQAGQKGQPQKDQQQDQKSDPKDQKNDPKNQQAGQNGQPQKDQQQQDQKSDPKDQKNDPKNQQAGQKGQPQKDQQQDQKSDPKDQKNDPKNQQAGQNGQPQKDQQQQDQKSDPKDQKNDPKNQQTGQNGQPQKDQPQDQKGDPKDQKNDPKNQQAGQNGQPQKDQQQDQKGEPKDQKNDPKNQQASQNGQPQKDQQQDQKGEPKDQKNDPKNQQASQNGQPQKDQQQDQKGEPKDQKNDPKNQEAGQDGQPQKDQKEMRNSRADSARPLPLNATGKKPSTGQPQAASAQASEPGEFASAGGERREPGQMTKEEAQQLLDALKNDERKAPAISMQGLTPGQAGEQQQPTQDW